MLPSSPTGLAQAPGQGRRGPPEPTGQVSSQAKIPVPGCGQCWVRSANHGRARLSVENSPRPPSQGWLPSCRSPRSSPSKGSVGRNEGVTSDREGVLSLLGLTVPLLPSPPLASCSCVCSTSGLLVKTQVGCSTVPCLAWVWKIWRDQRQAPGDRGPQTCSPHCSERFSSTLLARFPPPGISQLRSPPQREPYLTPPRLVRCPCAPPAPGLHSIPAPATPAHLSGNRSVSSLDHEPHGWVTVTSPAQGRRRKLCGMTTYRQWGQEAGPPGPSPCGRC